MSVRASRAVWAARIAPPTRKMVLLALADHLRDETGQLNPSLQTLADKVGVTRGQAQRIVRDLIGQGLVSVAANRFGGAPGSTPQYRLHLDRISSLASTGSTNAAGTNGADAAPTGSTDAAGAGGATDGTGAGEGLHRRTGGVAPMRKTGSTGAAQTTMNHHEPSEEPKKTRTRAAPAASAHALLPDVSSQILDDWQAVRKAKRVGPVTATAVAAIQREARKAGITVQAALEICCERGWASFRADWGAVSPKASARAQAPRTFDQQDFTQDVTP